MLQSPTLLEVLLTILYPMLGFLLIIFAAIGTIWLILHVEYGDRFSIPRTTIAIVLIALTTGFGIHFILFFMGL